MKPFYLSALCMILSLPKPSLSQEINLGARITSLGNTGAALRDVWSLQANPAGVVDLNKPAVSIDCRSEFLNKEVRNQSLVVVIPLRHNFLGLAFQQYGFSAFTDQKFAFSYVKAFGEALSIAVNLNYHRLEISQYGSATAITSGIGFQFQPSRSLILGCHIANPFKNGYRIESAATIPVKFEFGTSYTLSDKLMVNTGLVKLLQSETSLRTGLEYSISSSFALRGGIATAPFKQFAGVGCKVQHLKIDAAISSQALLGYSPQLALGYDF